MGGHMDELMIKPTGWVTGWVMKVNYMGGQKEWVHWVGQLGESCGA